MRDAVKVIKAFCPIAVGKTPKRRASSERRAGAAAERRRKDIFLGRKKYVVSLGRNT